MNKVVNNKENIKSNKGITLIALVITIIVLLILVTVTVATGIANTDSARDDKLKTELGIVQNAVLQQYHKYTVTKNEADIVGTNISGAEVSDAEMQTMANEMGITLSIIEINSKEYKYYRLTPEQLKEIGIKQAKDTYIVNYGTGEVINDEKRLTSSNEPLYLKGINIVGERTVEVGDYVDYIPDSNNTTYVIDKTYSGYTSDQNIPKEDLNWRVLEKKGNQIILICDEPTISRVFLQSAAGYNNGVLILDNVCNNLYGGTKGDSRNLKIEDIESKLNLDVWDYRQYVNSTGHKYGDYGPETTASSTYPQMWAQEKDNKINTFITSGTLGKSEQKNYVSGVTTASSIQAIQTSWEKWPIHAENFKESIYHTLFIKGAINSSAETYWLSSRSNNNLSTTCVTFDIRYIGQGGVLNPNTIYASNGYTTNLNARFRPVVTLKSSALIDTNNPNTDGSTPEKAWKIK